MKDSSLIIKKIDAFKYSILNLDSPFEIIEKKGGQTVFIESILNSLKSDKRARKYL